MPDIVKGINADQSVPVRQSGSRELVIPVSTLTWLTADLTGAKSVTATTPTNPGPKVALFINNNCAGVAVNVDVISRQTLVTGEYFLLTSFSVAANTDRVVLLDDLFCGDLGARITVTPAAAATNNDTVILCAKEVA